MLLLQGRIAPSQKKNKNKNKIYMTLCVIGRVKFERDCGKMYSRHLFPYGGLGQQSLHGERWMGQVTSFTKNVYVMLRVDLYNENVVSVNVT